MTCGVPWSVDCASKKGTRKQVIVCRTVRHGGTMESASCRSPGTARTRGCEKYRWIKCSTHFLKIFLNGIVACENRCTLNPMKIIRKRDPRRRDCAKVLTKSFPAHASGSEREPSRGRAFGSVNARNLVDRTLLGNDKQGGG